MLVRDHRCVLALFCLSSTWRKYYCVPESQTCNFVPRAFLLKVGRGEGGGCGIYPLIVLQVEKENIKDICNRNNHSAVGKTRKDYQFKRKLSIHLCPLCPLCLHCYIFSWNGRRFDSVGSLHLFSSSYTRSYGHFVIFQFDKTVCRLVCVKSSKFFGGLFTFLLLIVFHLYSFSFETSFSIEISYSCSWLLRHLYPAVRFMLLWPLEIA